MTTHWRVHVHLQRETACTVTNTINISLTLPERSWKNNTGNTVKHALKASHNVHSDSVHGYYASVFKKMSLFINVCIKYTTLSRYYLDSHPLTTQTHTPIPCCRSFERQSPADCKRRANHTELHTMSKPFVIGSMAESMVVTKKHHMGFQRQFHHPFFIQLKCGYSISVSQDVNLCNHLDIFCLIRVNTHSHA